ncbi:MAG: 16S rRNA (guanine(966)-N(2))-methyltransferase RsmD [Helicobacteraceae bacterium]|nr:16S rRNA (guanine(966)-N(2))-methyltransferase RsmD [Helicobacteraceae bacterium]
MKKNYTKNPTNKPKIRKKPNSRQDSNTKITSIRIIGGIFRGRILNIEILPNTRPTKAIVRESVFNTLQNFISNRTFIEVFAGYGSVGFEALSRGAKEVIFIEKDIKSFRILEQNIALFTDKIPHLKDKLKTYNEDSFIFLTKLDKNIDIFYFDPPFGENGEYYLQSFEILEKLNLDNKMIIFEHISNFKMPCKLKNLNLIKTKKFGRTSISYYQ